MRDIKFRAWDGSKMITDGVSGTGSSAREMLIDFNGRISERNMYGLDAMSGTEITQPDLILTQYIGQKDGERKDLYESDIVRLFYGNRELIGVVTWSDQVPGWYIKVGKMHFEINNLAMYGDENGIVLTSVYIIGNIYEHKHLLEQLSKP